MKPSSPLAALTDRELEVSGLIADGLSNEAIGRRLAISVKTVESICSPVFRKLSLTDSPDANRRVQAAVMYLAESPSGRGLDGIPVRRNMFVGRTDELSDLSASERMRFGATS